MEQQFKVSEPAGKFTLHVRTGVSEMRPYEKGEDMTGVSVSDPDKKLVTLEGGWIARNPRDHEDMWYVAEDYYDENLRPL